MAKKMIQGIVEIPEIVSGYDLDWSEYELPGGERFVELYEKTINPTIQKQLDLLNAELMRIRTRESRRNAIRKGIDAAASIAKMVKECNDYDEKDVNPEILPKLETLVAVSAELSNSEIFEPTNAKEEIASIEDDIKYLNALDSYIKRDREFDMVLFAIYGIEPKYKAKVFRHASRLLADVELCRKFIDASHSSIKEKLSEVTNPLLEMLGKTYPTISALFKKWKKAAAKGSLTFWETVR